MSQSAEHTGEDIKLAEQQRWGKAFHNLPRFAGALRACKSLSERGEPVTRKAVRLMMGGGSDRDYAPIVQCFNARNTVLERFDATPDALTMIVMESVNSAFADLNQQYQSLIEAEAQTFTDALNASGEELIKLEDDYEQQQKTVSQRDAEIGQLKAQLARADEQIAVLNLEQQRLREAQKVTLTEKDQLQKQLSAQEQAHLVLQHEHTQTQDKQAQDYKDWLAHNNQANDREVDRLMGLIAQARADAKTVKADTHHTLSELRLQLSETRQAEKAQAATLARLETQIQQAPHLTDALAAQAALQDHVKALTDQVEAGESARAELTERVISLCEKPNLDSQGLRVIMEEVLSKMDSAPINTKKGKLKGSR